MIWLKMGLVHVGVNFAVGLAAILSDVWSRTRKWTGLGACGIVGGARSGWKRSPLFFSSSAFTFYCRGLFAGHAAPRSFLVDCYPQNRELRLDLGSSESFPRIGEFGGSQNPFQVTFNISLLLF